MFFWLSYSIFHQVGHQKNLRASLDQFSTLFHGMKLAGFILVLLLMILNWTLESRKWQILVDPLEQVSLMKSFLAILSGLSLAVVTPNRIGEYAGRILYLKNIHKLRAITVTVVGSFSQLIVTIIAGIFGLVWDIHFSAGNGPNPLLSSVWEKISLFLLGILTVGCVILYFRLDLIVNLFGRFRPLRRLRTLVLILGRFSFRDLRRVLVLSGLRYLVFSIQYLILLRLLGVGVIWWQGLAMISLIFLVMAIVPTIALAEIAIRGKVSLFFLGLLSTNTLGIASATVGIWFINLILPAILGSLLLLRVRVFQDK